MVLGIHGFHHGLGFLTSTLGAEHASANPLGLNFGGSWIGAALIAVLAPVYIFYGFESAGDISEETKNASRQVPRAMRLMAVVTVAGVIVYFAAHGGREIGAHTIDTDAPGYAPPPAPEPSAADAVTPEGATTLKEAP